MLKLRRGRVVETDPLTVEVDGSARRAWADRALVGPCERGDEVVVNVAALDLGLGSGGFDVVHVNLTRGLEAGDPPPGVHVMKLNYTSLQHAVDPIDPGRTEEQRPIPVVVLPLHGHLAPVAWALRGEGGGGPRAGFVQAAGGALAGALSRDVGALLERGLLCDHVTAGPCFGGRREAISTIGALAAAGAGLGWDAAIVGPGPGILGSATAYGHGGMAALEGAHAALALGLEPIVSPRMSEGDPRPRHRGLSHHTATVLALLLRAVTVAAPPGAERELVSACGDRHRVESASVDLGAYAASGLPTRTMGRSIEDDGIFFAAPLAAGAIAGARLKTP